MLLFSVFSLFCTSLEINRDNGNIYVYANKLFPVDNPSETYEYPHNLPLCFKKDTKRLKVPFLAGLTGVSPIFTDIILHFNNNENNLKLCTTKITKDNIKKLKQIIADDYVVEYSIDSIPCWLHIGSTASGKPKVFSHILFTVSRNNESVIVDVNVTGTNSIDIFEGQTINYTYSTRFVEPAKIKVKKEKEAEVQNFHHDKERLLYRQMNRMERLKGSSATETSVHTYSIMLTVVLAMLLLVLVSLLKNKATTRENISMSRFDGFELDNQSEKGWKAVHGDVFRPPCNVSYAACLSGAGVHIALTICIYTLYVWKGETSFPALIAAFALTSSLCGFTSASIAQAFGMRKWLRMSFGSISVVPLLLFIIGLPAWIMAVIKGSTNHIAATHLAGLLLIYVLVCLPLSGLGGFIAAKEKLFLGNKCEVSLVPRHIPPTKWYLKEAMLAGFVCTVVSIPAIFEIHYILVTMFNPFVFYDHTYLAISCILLPVVSACSSVIGTYLLLQSENYKWQWASFYSSASSFIPMFFYSVIFYIKNTNMSGIYQTVVFFSSSAALSLIVALVMGGMGFMFSNIFVHQIYSGLKTD